MSIKFHARCIRPIDDISVGNIITFYYSKEANKFCYAYRHKNRYFTPETMNHYFAIPASYLVRYIEGLDILDRTKNALGRKVQSQIQYQFNVIQPSQINLDQLCLDTIKAERLAFLVITKGNHVLVGFMKHSKMGTYPRIGKVHPDSRSLPFHVRITTKDQIPKALELARNYYKKYYSLVRKDNAQCEEVKKHNAGKSPVTVKVF